MRAWLMVQLLLVAPTVVVRGFGPSPLLPFKGRANNPRGLLSSSAVGKSATTGPSSSKPSFAHPLQARKPQGPMEELARTMATMAASAALLWLVATSPAALAADFAKQNISGQDFSGQDLSNRDFTSVVAKKTNFHNCNLQGSKFANADLVGADFSGADVRGATFVDATLDGTSFANAQAQKASFSATILDIANLQNVDMTDSLWPSKYRIMICDMDVLGGTNPVTGIESRESLMCTDYVHRS